MSTRPGGGGETGNRVGINRPGLPGLAVAAMTAAVSGLAVFVNSYAVHAIAQPSVYTAAKNLVATVVLVVAALVGRMVRHRHRDSMLGRFVTAPAVGHGDSGADHRRGGLASALPAVPLPRRAIAWLGLAYVGIVGGGLAFVLFFDGLAATSAAPAAFWHDTLIVWVALLALPVLRERLRWWNVAAVGLLIAGQVAVSNGVGHLTMARGELLVLCATLLWAVETVVAKQLLRELAPSTVALVRMGIGAVTLVAYLFVTGALHSLGSLDASQVGWAMLTGVLLALYVGTWFTALARARAIDVTSILVASALVTWLLQAMAGTEPTGAAALGLILVAAGAGLVVWLSWGQAHRTGRPRRATFP